MTPPVFVKLLAAIFNINVADKCSDVEEHLLSIQDMVDEVWLRRDTINAILDWLSASNPHETLAEFGERIHSLPAGLFTK